MRFMKCLNDDAKKRITILGVDGMFARLSALLAPGMIAVIVFRFGGVAKNSPCPLFCVPLRVLYFVLFYVVQALYGISVQAYTRIGRRFVIVNHAGIFVVAESIGDDFTVCESVTVGNVRGKKRLPIIGNNVYLEPGCKVLGEVTIGDNVVVRANSLVLNDVPSNSIAVGNPARIYPLGHSAVG